MSALSRGGATLLLFLPLLCSLLDASAGTQGVDPYKVLGVRRTATSEDIQRAYRQRAKETHPDKNSSPRADEEFRRVADAFEILGDPERRRRHDEVVRQKDRRRHWDREQEREQARRREESRRKREEQARRERERKQAEMVRRARAARGGMVRISNLEQFERTMLDPSRRVYKTYGLIMFVGNKKAERSGEQELYFPYPFAGEAGGPDSRYGDMIRTAKVRFNSQTDLTRLFHVKTQSKSPHIIFCKKGDAVGDFHIFRPTPGVNAHDDFKQWVDSLLVVQAIIVNDHTLPVELMVMRNAQVTYSRESFPSGHEFSLSLRAGDRILAFDKRVDRFPGASRVDERITLSPGVLLLDVFVALSEDVYTVSNSRCYDLSTQCQDWTASRRGKKNRRCGFDPEFMHHICPLECGVCSESFASGISYAAFHQPIHRFPPFLQGGVRSWRCFVEDMGSILRYGKNAAAAFFVAGLLAAFDFALLRSVAASGPRLMGGRGGSRDAPSPALDVALLLLVASACACAGWMALTGILGAPPWMRGLQSDLVAVAVDVDVFSVLVAVGVLASAYLRALLGRIGSGRMGANAAVLFAATLLAVVAATPAAISFMMSSNATRAFRWARLWRYRKNAGLAVVIFGALVGVGLMSLKRLFALLQRASAIPMMTMNFVVLLAAVCFAWVDSHFQKDLMHVIELRKNAAFAFVVLGVVTGNVVATLFSARHRQGGIHDQCLGRKMGAS